MGRWYKWVVVALLGGAYFFHQADRAIFGAAPSLARELASAARETLRDWAYLLPRPRDWAELPSAPVRRLVQRVSHWRGARAAD